MSCDITYEELVAFVDGDLSTQRIAQIGEHVAVCDECAERIKAIRGIDVALVAVRRIEPGAGVVFAARRALAQVTRGGQAVDVMTLDEVAQYLRITSQQLGEIMHELPAFEMAGQVRVRREALVKWIEQKERNYTRQTNQSWVARARVGSVSLTVA